MNGRLRIRSTAAHPEGRVGGGACLGAAEKQEGSFRVAPKVQAVKLEVVY